VGKPFNSACQKMGRRQAQTVSSACNRRLINLLSYKLAGAIEVDESYTSQTCPVCGGRSKQGRTYRCPCGYEAPRDVVGCANIRIIGIEGALRPGCGVPNVVQWVYPDKYPGRKPGSRAGTTQVARKPFREAHSL
jgi:transposase